MKDLEAISNNLNVKIEKLVHLHDKLKADHAKIMTEKQGLVKKLAGQEALIKKLEEETLKFKVALTLKNSTEQTTDIKLKINELVREIDKSVALLNK